MFRIKTMLVAVLFILAGILFSAAQAQKAFPQPNTQVSLFRTAPQAINEYLPDFRIQTVTINGSKAVVQIINRCKGAAPASRILLHLYKGAAKDSGEDKIYEFDVAPIAGGATTKVEVDLSSPFGHTKTFAGKYYRFELDPHNKIKETVEGNNWFEKVGQPFPDNGNSCEPVKAPPPGSIPDLRITKVTINGGQMYVEVTNQCKGAAAKTRMRLNLYGGKTKGSPDGVVLEDDFPALDGGAKKSILFDLKNSAKFKTFGDNYYRLEADPYNVVKEGSEVNNHWEKSLIPFPDSLDICKPK